MPEKFGLPWRDADGFRESNTEYAKPDATRYNLARIQYSVVVHERHIRVNDAAYPTFLAGGPEFSQSTFDAVQDAWSAGIVVVAAAGNDGTTAPFYPAAHPNVVSVGAFDEDHKRAPFSNYGNWVDVSAPGNEIFSTYSMVGCGGAGSLPGEVGCYTWNTGTSMASGGQHREGQLHSADGHRGDPIGRTEKESPVGRRRDQSRRRQRHRCALVDDYAVIGGDL